MYTTVRAEKRRLGSFAALLAGLLIVLLQPDEEIGRRVDIEELAGYAKGLQAIVEEHFAAWSGASGFDLIVSFELRPDGPPEIRTAIRPEGRAGETR